MQSFKHHLDRLHPASEFLGPNAGSMLHASFLLLQTLGGKMTAPIRESPHAGDQIGQTLALLTKMKIKILNKT